MSTKKSRVPGLRRDKEHRISHWTREGDGVVKTDDPGKENVRAIVTGAVPIRMRTEGEEDQEDQILGWVRITPADELEGREPNDPENTVYLRDGNYMLVGDLEKALDDPEALQRILDQNLLFDTEDEAHEDGHQRIREHLIRLGLWKGAMSLSGEGEMSMEQILDDLRRQTQEVGLEYHEETAKRIASALIRSGGDHNKAAEMLGYSDEDIEEAKRRIVIAAKEAAGEDVKVAVLVDTDSNVAAFVTLDKEGNKTIHDLSTTPEQETLVAGYREKVAS
jgi:hypothetical protein